MVTTASTTRAGALVRRARLDAGLSQAELARRAGVTQSVVSAYEAGSRQPSLPTLERLVVATGYQLAIGLGAATPAGERLRGPLGRRLLEHRGEVLRAAHARGIHDVCVVGSTARAEERDGSDIDLLVTVAPGVGLFGLFRLQAELEGLLGVAVELIPSERVKRAARQPMAADAVPL